MDLVLFRQEWHIESSMRMNWFRGNRRLANFLAQHCGVVPTETEVRVRRISPESAERFSTALFVEEKNVAFFAFDQCQHIEIVRHCSRAPSSELSEFSSSGSSLLPLPRPKLLSAFWPAPQYSRFARSTARREHFCQMQMTAEADKVVAALKIRFPLTDALVIFERNIVL